MKNPKKRTTCGSHTYIFPITSGPDFGFGVALSYLAYYLAFRSPLLSKKSLLCLTQVVQGKDITLCLKVNRWFVVLGIKSRPL